MKKTTMGGIIVLLIAGILTLTAGIGSSWFTNGDIKTWFNSWGKEKQEVVQPDNNDNSSELTFNETESNGIQLLSAQLPRSAYAANGVSELARSAYTMTATVQPANAENKKVDWSVSWVEGATLSGHTISEYLTIVPSSDGNTTAVLTCLKSFRGSLAVVKVTTREGGYTASCVIDFVGKPSSIEINGGNACVANFNQSSEYTISLSNGYNDVGETFYNNLSVKSLTVGGTYTSCTMSYSTSGAKESDVQTGTSISNLKLGGDANLPFTDTISATISNNKLVVTSSATPNSNYFEHSAGSGMNYTMYGYIKSDLNVYADIVVSCGNIEKTMRVNFRLGVTGVSMPNEKIEI